MDIRHLLRYADSALAQLKTTLAEFDAEWKRPHDTVFGPRTIRELVCHMAGAEERWIVQRAMGKDIKPYENHAPREREAVFADYAGFRMGTWEFVNGLGDDWHRQVPYSLPPGALPETLSVHDMLIHLVNHQTHHTAQISLLLQLRGLEPPDFDYVFLRPTRRR